MKKIDPETLKAQSAERFRKLYAVMEALDHYGQDWQRQLEIDEREQKEKENENL